ncbi:unnamed protein product [Amoebophrya sp. A25]|nr:unnamed protein product [Amoebophrya sp. A25]|eukprot:GSA25T00023584001.1
MFSAFHNSSESELQVAMLVRDVGAFLPARNVKTACRSVVGWISAVFWLDLVAGRQQLQLVRRHQKEAFRSQDQRATSITGSFRQRFREDAHSAGIGDAGAADWLKKRSNRKYDRREIDDDPPLDTTEFNPPLPPFGPSRSDTADLDPKNELQPVSFFMGEAHWGSLFDGYGAGLKTHPNGVQSADKADVVFLVWLINGMPGDHANSDFTDIADGLDAVEPTFVEEKSETERSSSGSTLVHKKEGSAAGSAQRREKMFVTFLRSLLDKKRYPQRSPSRPYALVMNGLYFPVPELMQLVEKRAVGRRGNETSTTGDFLFVNIERLQHDQKPNTTRIDLPGVTVPQTTCQIIAPPAELPLVGDLKLKPGSALDGRTFFVAGRASSNMRLIAPTRRDLAQTFAKWYAEHKIHDEVDFFGVSRNATQNSAASHNAYASTLESLFARFTGPLSNKRTSIANEHLNSSAGGGNATAMRPGEVPRIYFERRPEAFRPW